MRDAGLRVSSLCRGGFLTAADAGGRAAARRQPAAPLEEAAALGAPVLVLVAGGLPEGDRDLPAPAPASPTRSPSWPRTPGRRRAPRLEPLHPMYCADRAVLSTLGQALDLAEPFPVDRWASSWTPSTSGGTRVDAQIARAGERIATYQLVRLGAPAARPTCCSGAATRATATSTSPPSPRAVAAAGYSGDIEVEIFNADVWAPDGDEVVATMRPATPSSWGPQLCR